MIPGNALVVFNVRAGEKLAQLCGHAGDNFFGQAAGKITLGKIARAASAQAALGEG